MSDLNKFRRKGIIMSDTCLICLDELTDEGYAKLPCNHKFHTDCFVKYACHNDQYSQPVQHADKIG